MHLCWTAADHPTAVPSTTPKKHANIPPIDYAGRTQSHREAAALPRDWSYAKALMNEDEQEHGVFSISKEGATT